MWHYRKIKRNHPRYFEENCVPPQVWFNFVYNFQMPQGATSFCLNYTQPGNVQPLYGLERRWFCVSEMHMLWQQMCINSMRILLVNLLNYFYLWFLACAAIIKTLVPPTFFFLKHPISLLMKVFGHRLVIWTQTGTRNEEKGIKGVLFRIWGLERNLSVFTLNEQPCYFTHVLCCSSSLTHFCSKM